MDGRLSHIALARPDSGRAIGGGGPHEGLDNHPTVPVSECERLPADDQFEIGCSSVVMTRRAYSSAC
jgi:hypothetical protein